MLSNCLSIEPQKMFDSADVRFRIPPRHLSNTMIQIDLLDVLDEAYYRTVEHGHNDLSACAQH